MGKHGHPSQHSVLIVADVPGWCYERRAQAIAKHAPPGWRATWCVWKGFIEAVNQPARHPDLVFLLDYTQAEQAKRIMDSLWLDVPLIVSWNRGPGERTSLLHGAYDFSDWMVCNNRQAYDWLRERGFTRVSYICNGVDLQTFRVKVPFEQRMPRVLWTGSDAPQKAKGWDEIIQPLVGRLAKFGIETDFRPVKNSIDPRVMTQDEMVDWYNSGRVILCASKSEGTPNTTLEGMACGCVPVSTRTGNIVDVGRDGSDCLLVERDVESFVTAILRATSEYQQMAPRAVAAVQKLGYGEPAWHAHRYYELFDSVLNLRQQTT